MVTAEVLTEKVLKITSKKNSTICWFPPDLIVHQTKSSSEEVAYCVDLTAPDSSPPFPC